MNRREREALDRYITGNWGEDQLKSYCADCGNEFSLPPRGPEAAGRLRVSVFISYARDDDEPFVRRLQHHSSGSGNA